MIALLLAGAGILVVTCLFAIVLVKLVKRHPVDDDAIDDLDEADLDEDSVGDAGPLS